MQKYYCENTLWAKTVSSINWFVIKKLLKEYPHYFTLEKDHDACTLLNKKNGTLLQWNLQNQQLENSIYRSLFDALCCQVQEDMAICQLNRDEDWLAAIHLCAPNHWARKIRLVNHSIPLYAPVNEMGKPHANI